MQIYHFLRPPVYHEEIRSVFVIIRVGVQILLNRYIDFVKVDIDAFDILFNLSRRDLSLVILEQGVIWKHELISDVIYKSEGNNIIWKTK